MFFIFFLNILGFCFYYYYFITFIPSRSCYSLFYFLYWFVGFCFFSLLYVFGGYGDFYSRSYCISVTIVVVLTEVNIFRWLSIISGVVLHFSASMLWPFGFFSCFYCSFYFSSLMVLCCLF